MAETLDEFWLQVLGLTFNYHYRSICLNVRKICTPGVIATPWTILPLQMILNRKEALQKYRRPASEI